MLVCTGCGKHKSARQLPFIGSGGQPQHQVAPAFQPVVSLDEALAEIDAYPCPEGVDTGLFQRLKDELATQLKTKGVSKVVSVPPAGDENRVTDLALADNGDETYTLTWHYRNLGDYSQNGKVGIEEISEIAMHYGEEVPEDDTERNSLQAVIDGSGNGKVYIEDITPMAQYYGVECAGYRIEGGQQPDGTFSLLQEESFTGGAGDGRLELSALVTDVSHVFYRVVPYDSANQRGVPSNPVLGPGDPPEIISVTPPNGEVGEQKVATATVEGRPPLTYLWNFGSGCEPLSSSEESPTVALTAEGEWPATLTVTSYWGEDVEHFTLVVALYYWQIQMPDTDGDVGTNTSLAFGDDGFPAIAYHDQGNENLKFVRYTGEDWIAETVDNAGRVGWYTSLAFDVDDNPVIAYYDITEGDLKLAWWDGADWDIEVVDSVGNVGAGASLVFLGDGNPAISYYDDTIEMLKYAAWNGASWDFASIAAGGGYSIMVCSGYTSLALDTDGYPAIAYYRAIVGDPPDQLFARWDGSSWNTEPVILEISDAFAPDLEFDDNGDPAITYIDDHSIYIAWWNGFSWDEVPVTTVQTLNYRSALVFDAEGNPMVSNYGPFEGEYCIALSSWTDGEWFAEIVDDTEEVVGQYFSLALAPDGTPAISYYDMTNHYLKFAWYH